MIQTIRIKSFPCLTLLITEFYGAIPAQDIPAADPIKIIMYDKTFDKWSLIEQDVEMIIKSKGISISLDSLELVRIYEY